MDRAEEKAGPEDVGEQALMRGLDTAFPFFLLGLSWSSVGRRSDDRPHNNESKGQNAPQALLRVPEPKSLIGEPPKAASRE